VSSSRVASWIYDVINVLLDAFEAESGLLARGNTTWRFFNQRLEHISPATSYLTHNGRHILRDLVREHPEVAAKIRQHDQLRDQLERAATDAYRSILAKPGFRERVEDARARFLAKHANAVPTGAFAPEKHADLIAEHLVNHIKELSPQYTDSEFWKEHGREFVAFSPADTEFERALAGLLAFDRETQQWLETMSFELCREFDVPAAPSGSVGF
jgi:hypothetical protein